MNDRDARDTERPDNSVADTWEQVKVVVSYAIVIAAGSAAGYWTSGIIGAVVGAVVAIPLVLFTGALVLYWTLSYFDTGAYADD